MTDQTVWNYINNLWPSSMRPPTEREAIAGVKRLYKRAMGKPWTGKVQATSGNRYTWIRRGTLFVNPDRGYYGGWRDIVHELSHYAHQRVNSRSRPHDAGQAYIERDLSEYAIKHRFPEGGHVRPLKETKAPADKVAERFRRMLVRRDAWEAKAKRANNALKKLNSEIRAYRHRYGDRLI